MEIFTTRNEITTYLDKKRQKDNTIGLVPTMGALHNGHLSLLKEADKQVDITVCSIFVNPTQFNDPVDLAKYPRPLDHDIKLLQNSGCDILFLPAVSEMYPEQNNWFIKLDGLDNILEGVARPGHYQGVTQVVHELFSIIGPDVAFFGQKDYQQFLVISEMVKKLKLSIKLVMCPIVREKDGLAMSSRNVHLSPEEHQYALALSKVLKQTKSAFKEKSITRLKRDALAYLQSVKGVEPEYFEICNSLTLKPLVTKTAKKVIALVAAKVGPVRLIDNIILK